MGVAVFALPGQSSRAGAVLVFGPEVNFAWQAQGIRHIGASKRSFYVAGAKDCVSRGRRRESAPWMRYFEVKRLNS